MNVERNQLAADSIHLMNVERNQLAADSQTKPTALGCESRCRLLLSTPTIVI